MKRVKRFSTRHDVAWSLFLALIAGSWVGGLTSLVHTPLGVISGVIVFSIVGNCLISRVFQYKEDTPSKLDKPYRGT